VMVNFSGTVKSQGTIRLRVGRSCLPGCSIRLLVEVMVNFSGTVKSQGTIRLRVQCFTRRSGGSNDGYDLGGAGYAVISKLPFRGTYSQYLWRLFFIYHEGVHIKLKGLIKRDMEFLVGVMIPFSTSTCLIYL
jgi:hypothetical protein